MKNGTGIAHAGRICVTDAGDDGSVGGRDSWWRYGDVMLIGRRRAENKHDSSSVNCLELSRIIN